MSHDVQAYPYGGCIERAMEASVTSWCREYGCGRTEEDLRANEIRTVEALASERHSGILQVTITVYARKVHNDTSEHFRFDRVAYGLYVYRASTIPLL